MKLSLNLINIFIGCLIPLLLNSQNPSTQETKNSYQYQLQFEVENQSFLSPKIPIENSIPTPFLMVSGYVPTENFEGDFYFKTKTNEVWSNWKKFPRFHEGITPDRTVFFAGEISPRTQSIQIKSTQSLPYSFILRWYAPGHSTKNNIAPTRNTPTTCTCEQPDFSGRTDWCPSGNCPPDSTPQNTTPTHIIVHHSAGQTTSSDFAAVVRSYWELHVNTNGWDDIGYNWLIDGNGVIYEGRGEGRQGAHFSCMNQNTTGVCVIGNYENAIPTDEAIGTLQDFIAWEACSKNIDVLGEDFHNNSNMNLDNISGHRDGNNSSNSCSSTVCPGENLYSLLPTIREQLSGLACLQENPVHVNELLENEAIDIFPNPNYGDFQISWKNIEIKDIVIYNSIGQEVFFVNTLLQHHSRQFNLKEKGIYFVKIRLTDQRIFSKKIIIHI